MSDKRTHFRKSFEAEASIADVMGNTWTSVRMLDISVGGAALMVDEPLPAGSSRMIRFYLPGNPERLSLVARVAHCTPHTFLAGYRVGIEFVRRENNAFAIIEQFIKNSQETSKS